MKHTIESKDNNYIIVVRTINIANNFYNAFDNKKDSFKLCIKIAFDNNVRVIITMHHTASRCLGSIIEFTHGALLNKYGLFIDEAHLLLQHQALREMMREFNHAGLITSTPRELKHLSAFKEYVPINPSMTTHYQKNCLLISLPTCLYSSMKWSNW